MRKIVFIDTEIDIDSGRVGDFGAVDSDESQLDLCVKRVMITSGHS